jgi:hypothetical protein
MDELTRQVMAQVESIDVPECGIIWIKTDASLSAENFNSIALYIKEKHPEVTVIYTDTSFSLLALDEEQMRTQGWVRSSGV